MARGRVRPARLQELDEEAVDSIDVPAAVVCALCGRGDCPGCIEDERTGASGVIAIIPWERPQSPWQTRFFATVQATTRGAEGFFCAMPDGAVSPALRFAVLAETFAVASTAAGAGSPGRARHSGSASAFSRQWRHAPVGGACHVGRRHRVYGAARGCARGSRRDARAGAVTLARAATRALRVRMGFWLEPSGPASPLRSSVESVLPARSSHLR